MSIQPIKWEDGCLKLIDQTKLPSKLEIIECRDYHSVADAIKTMKVRGAPAIGASAAFGMAIGAGEIKAKDRQKWFEELEKIAETLKQTRPTAVNLFWAINRMMETARSHKNLTTEEIVEALKKEAEKIAKEDIESNLAIGRFGNALVPQKARILTHCNAGALATVGYGTALGVIRAAHEAGKDIEVFADETRPFLQGARLTAWELLQDNIPVTLITDNMAGYVMSKGMVDLVIVGADRIAANGDTANKIGTYTLAVLAKENNIPFYIAAPVSTIDMSITTGDEIPIEERAHDEVTHIRDTVIAPEGVRVFNPAFDVTPHNLITAIITDKGVVRKPYEQTLKNLV
ncbi:MAG: methylthioribose-phosphate isomerase [Thermosediminibacterales bacterium]|nr:methylthioribose-phosphate isomerase [Thermosediminibacterales bacterium]